MSVRVATRKPTPVKAASPQRSAMRKPSGRLRRAIGNRAFDSLVRTANEVARSPGRSLDTETRAFMEPRFGHDFSGVRIHTGEQANRAAHAVSARAYTIGNDIVFSGGQFNPKSSSGRRLLAHELTHVVQQQSGAKQ